MKFFLEIFNFLQDKIDKKFKLKSYFLAIAICLSSLAEMFTIAALIPLLTKSFKVYEDKINPSGNPFFLLEKLDIKQAIFLFLIFFLLRVLFVSFIKLYSVIYMENIKVTLQTYFFKEKISLPWSRFIYIDKASMLRLISNDCSRVANLFFAIVSALNQFVLLIVFSAGLVVIDPFIALNLIFFFSTLLLIYIFLNKTKNYTFGIQEISKLNLIFESIKSGLECAKEIKIYNRLKDLLNKFNYSVYEIRNIIRKRELLLIYPKIIFEIILVFLIVTFFYFTHDKNHSLNSKLIFFSLIGLRLLPIFYNISYMLQRINHLLPFCEDFVTQLNDIKKMQDSEDKIEKKIFNEKINTIIFKDVSFSYNKHKVLTNLNYAFERGGVYGITGRSGSGKTTLLDLLNGLITPTKGEVKYNNVATHKIHKPYQLVSYIPQDCYILEGTIKENITFFENNEINENLYNEALEFSGINKLIESNDLKRDQKIKEYGVNISGGQKQRISIARALYKNREIMIFDEATNALDNQSERTILNNFKKIKAQKVILLVSHNIQNYNICDHIISLDD